MPAIPPIPASLRAHVRSWTAFTLTRPATGRRRELPGPQVALVLELGSPVLILDKGSETRGSRYPGGFVVGLHDEPCLSELGEFHTGIEVHLTPLGARAFFGVAPHELARSVSNLPDLLPAAERSVAERLADRATWGERFAVFEDLLRRRISAAPDEHAAVAWATAEIERTGGTTRVDEIARELGYSRKHLVSLFHDHVGFPPKLYANLTRFDRVVRELKRCPEAPWAAPPSTSASPTRRT